MSDTFLCRITSIVKQAQSMISSKYRTGVSGVDLHHRRVAIHSSKFKVISWSSSTPPQLIATTPHVRELHHVVWRTHGWDAVTSGKLHLEDLDKPVVYSSIGELDSGDTSLFRLLQALLEMYKHCVSNSVSPIRLLRAVHCARIARDHIERPLQQVEVGRCGASRGESAFWCADDDDGTQNAWTRTLVALEALCDAADDDDDSLQEDTANLRETSSTDEDSSAGDISEDSSDDSLEEEADDFSETSSSGKGRSADDSSEDSSDEYTSNHNEHMVHDVSSYNSESDVAHLSSPKEQRERAAIDLALVLSWAVQTRFRSREYLQASELLETVWNAGVRITSAQALLVLGEYGQLSTG